MPETIERTGYLLRLTPYSDSSSMALALGEEGYFSFAVRGLSSPKSPFRSFMFPLTKVRFLLAKGKGDKLSLKEGSPLSKPPFGKSLEEMAFLSLLSEGLSKSSEGAEAKDLYALTGELMERFENKEEPLGLSALFLARLSALLGVAPETDGCLVCGTKKGLSVFSFEKGGFLCREHGSELPHSSLSLMQDVYRLFHLPRDGVLKLPKDETLYFIESFGIYLEERAGLSLKSVSFGKNL